MGDFDDALTGPDLRESYMSDGGSIIAQEKPFKAEAWMFGIAAIAILAICVVVGLGAVAALFIVSGSLYLTYTVWAEDPVLAVFITVVPLCFIVIIVAVGSGLGFYLYKTSIYRKYQRMNQEDESVPGFVTEFEE